MRQQCECPHVTPQPDAFSSALGDYSVRVVLGLAIVLLTYHVVRLGRALLRWLCWCLAHTGTNDASDVESGAPTPDDEESERLMRAVNWAVEERRMIRVRFAAHVMAFFFAAFLALRTVFYRDHLWKDISAAEARDLWREMYVPLVCGTAVSTIWQMAPWLVTPRQVDIVHVVVYMCSFVWGTLANENQYEYLYNTTWILFVRTVGAVIFGNFKLVAALSSLLCVANVVVLYVSFDFPLFRAHAALEVWALATMLVLCKVVETSLVAEVRSALEARNSSQNESTVHDLLSAMCDAVVRIGQDFQIQRRTPKLALLLLMQHTVNHLKGTKLTDFMTESDGERFRAIAEDRKTSTGSVNVHLRDEFGSLVGVRIVLARCQINLDEKECQLVGVTVDEEPGVDHVPERDDSFPTHPQIQHEATRTANSPSNRSRRSSQRRSSRSGASEVSLPLHNAGEDEVAVWLDAENGPLNIISCTAGFTVICGPASMESFSLLRSMENADVFMTWFQTAYNLKSNQMFDPQEDDPQEVGNEPEVLEPLNVILVPQRTCQKAFRISATCTFSEVTLEEDRSLVKLTFNNLCEVSVPRERPQKNRRRVRDALAEELPRRHSSTSVPHAVTSL